MNNNPYKAAVIGLGRIGMGYDYHLPTDQYAMTHCSAYQSHPAFILSAAVDPCSDKKVLFTQKYGRQAYSTLESLYRYVNPEVISLCVPTELHYDMFKQLIHFKPKVILCEKPLSESYCLAEEMKELAEKNNILLFVNYMRVFLPAVSAMKSEIMKGTLGKTTKIVVKYSNGFLNCATHFINLLLFLYEEVSQIKQLSEKMIESYNDDIDFSCSIDDIDVYFISTGNVQYSLFELEIIGEKAMIRYLDAGRDVKLYKCSKDHVLNDTVTLNHDPIEIQNDYNRFQWHVMNAISKSLMSPLLRTTNVNAAIETLRLAGCLLERG